MNHIITRSAVAVLFIFIGLTAAFSQGLTWESTMSMSIQGAKDMHSVSYYRPHMFKQSSEKRSTIFRLDKELLYMVDDEKKEYSEMTFAELESQVKEAGNLLDSKMAELKKKLADMPPEQAKMVEQMMGDKLKGGNAQTSVEVSKTSETKTISGYPCTKYSIQESGKETGSVWTTSSVSDFGAMKDDFKEFSARMGSLIPSKGSQFAAAMKQIDGFPVQTSIAGMTTTVTKVEKGSIPESEFSVPAGYKQVKPELMKERPGKHRPDVKPKDEEQKEQE